MSVVMNVIKPRAAILTPYAIRITPFAIRHKDYTISVIVSPKDCAQCHNTEVEQFTKSHHSRAAEILGSLDNVLAEVVEGNHAFRGESAVAVNGCWQCHGSKVKVMPNGDLDPTTWPNTGIGRINPDGSRGACTACHQRHEFSMVNARRPESCGKCHLGPDTRKKKSMTNPSTVSASTPTSTR